MGYKVNQAIKALKEIGAPVIERDDEGLFIISAEMNDDVTWADYYKEFKLSYLDDFGVHKDINKILDRWGMYAEWVNPGMLSVHYT